MLTHCGLLIPYAIIELCRLWFRWFVAWSVPSHYLNQCWFIINWTVRNQLQHNLNPNTIFLGENNLRMTSAKWHFSMCQPAYFLGYFLYLFPCRCSTARPQTQVTWRFSSTTAHLSSVRNGSNLCWMERFVPASEWRNPRWELSYINLVAFVSITRTICRWLSARLHISCILISVSFRWPLCQRYLSALIGVSWQRNWYFLCNHVYCTMIYCRINFWSWKCCSNSSALEMELLHSCTKPSTYRWLSIRLRWLNGVTAVWC